METERAGFHPVLILESPWYERVQPILKYTGPVGFALDVIAVILAVVSSVNTLALSVFGLYIWLIALLKLIKLE